MSRTCPPSNGGSGGGGGSESTGVGGGSDAGAAGDAGSAGASGGSGGLGSGGSGETSGSGGSTVEPEPCDGECDADECCDGECVNIDSDPAHCGACGEVCTLAGAEAECTGGTCVLTECAEGYLDCNGLADDGCEVPDIGPPAVPTPLRPMLGSYTGSLHARDVIGSLRPTFGWAEVQSVGCGVTYHLQVDDECPVSGFQECEFLTPEVDRTDLDTLEFALTEDLAVEESVAPFGRRYFWRVRACDALERCSPWSEARYLDVGRLREDINGDGYADAGAIASSNLYLFTGSPAFGDELLMSLDEYYEASAATLAQNRISAGAPSLRFLGDVNGDGFGDLGFSAGIPPDGDPQGYGFMVYLGGSDLQPDSLLPFYYMGEDGHGVVYPAGDLDNDGFADFLTSLGNRPEGSPLLAFFHGSADFNATATPIPTFLWGGTDSSEERTGAWFGSAGTMGDFNGDGYPDVAIANGADQARLILGHPEPDLEQYTDWSFDDVVPGCHPGRMVSLDMNGDDFDDLVFLCGTENLVTVRFGNATLEDAAAWSATLPSAAEHLACGDINADGYGDLLTSRKHVFLGGEAPQMTALALNADATNESSDPVALADHTGDGLLDAIVNFTWCRGNADLQCDSFSRIVRDDLNPVFMPLVLAR